MTAINTQINELQKDYEQIQKVAMDIAFPSHSLLKPPHNMQYLLSLRTTIYHATSEGDTLSFLFYLFVMLVTWRFDTKLNLATMEHYIVVGMFGIASFIWFWRWAELIFDKRLSIYVRLICFLVAVVFGILGYIAIDNFRFTLLFMIPFVLSSIFLLFSMWNPNKGFWKIQTSVQPVNGFELEQILGYLFDGGGIRWTLSQRKIEELQAWYILNNEDKESDSFALDSLLNATLNLLVFVATFIGIRSFYEVTQMLTNPSELLFNILLIYLFLFVCGIILSYRRGNIYRLRSSRLISKALRVLIHQKEHGIINEAVNQLRSEGDMRSQNEPARSHQNLGHILAGWAGVLIGLIIKKK